ncbi:glutathione S-transferase [Acrasis kona]|uniref:Glutathione S-transferase n=1 Tax=Acrasis kona TaxID=1008807 RepID=A0AAW2Z116_9EUKA
MSTQGILYSFRRCPYAMRTRFALYSAKINHEHREVQLKNKPMELLTLNPKGTVPVFHLSNGDVLKESMDIIFYALSSPQLSKMESELIEENDTTFKSSLDRYKYPTKYGQDHIEHRDICEAFLVKLENNLTLHKDGDMSLIEMALFPFVRQFANVDLDWFNTRPYPKLREWLQSVESSELYQQIMKKYSTWTTTSDPVNINF